MAYSAMAADDVAQPVTLMWDSGDTNIVDVTYKMYVKAGTNDWAPVITTTNTQLTLILKPGEYSFRVTAYNFWKESDPSNTVVISAPGSVTAPKNLKAQPGAANKPDQPALPNIQKK